MLSKSTSPPCSRCEAVPLRIGARHCRASASHICAVAVLVQAMPVRSSPCLCWALPLIAAALLTVPGFAAAARFAASLANPSPRCTVGALPQHCTALPPRCFAPPSRRISLLFIPRVSLSCRLCSARSRKLHRHRFAVLALPLRGGACRALPPRCFAITSLPPIAIASQLPALPPQCLAIPLRCLSRRH